MSTTPEEPEVRRKTVSPGGAMSPEKVAHVRATLDESGLSSAKVGESGLDIPSFVEAVVKRWPKVIARLGEHDRRCEPSKSSEPDP